MKQCRFVAVALLLVGIAAATAHAQTRTPELLLPGSDYHRSNLPVDPSGEWWVLHGSADTTVLETLDIQVTTLRTCGDEAADELSGRAIGVPEISRPILLIRGYEGLAAGPVRSVFVDDGIAGEARHIETRWNDLPVIVRHVTEDPVADQVGWYRIELRIGDRQFQLRADQWQGDGHWRLRWIGDLNRDGWPDVLVDASHKYSVYASRLFVSRVAADDVTFQEVATFTHTAC